MDLWNKFTAWLSGWPLDKKQEKQVREDDLLLAEAEAKSKPTPKTKKPKGLNPKKKKKSKGKKQGKSA